MLLSNDLMKGSGGCGASWGISNLNLNSLLRVYIGKKF